MNTCTSCEYMLVLYAWSFNIFINNKYSEAISSIAVVVWNESDNVKCGILTWACHRPLIMIHGNCFKYKKKTKNLNVKKKSETLVFWTCFYIGCTGRICFFYSTPMTSMEKNCLKFKPPTFHCICLQSMNNDLPEFQYATFMHHMVEITRFWSKHWGV